MRLEDIASCSYSVHSLWSYIILNWLLEFISFTFLPNRKRWSSARLPKWLRVSLTPNNCTNSLNSKSLFLFLSNQSKTPCKKKIIRRKREDKEWRKSFISHQKMKVSLNIKKALINKMKQKKRQILQSCSKAMSWKISKKVKRCSLILVWTLSKKV